MQCAADPEVETELACSRCGTPICPRCLVQTPVGARCRACAQLRRPPMYQVTTGAVAKGAGAMLLLGLAVGALWGFLLPGGFGLFLLLAFFVGPALGVAFATVLDKATNRKRGSVIFGLALGGLVVAYLTRLAISGVPIQGDLFGLLLIALAGFAAAGRLR